MPQPPAVLRVAFSVGEISGDVHGAELARALVRARPDAHIFGSGGERMRAAGVDVRLDVTGTSTVGLLDPLASLPRHAATLWTMCRLIRRSRPDLVVLVDAPALNFPIARFARQIGVRTTYYVAPHTWLWNATGATRRLARSVDAVVAIFEREAEIYRRAGLPVIYEGHPIVDLLASRPCRHSARQQLDLAPEAPVLGLFPGSRRHEIARLLPLMVRAACLLRERFPEISVVVAAASAQCHDQIAQMQAALKVSLRVSTRSRDLLAASDVNLAASGTVLLEAAILDAPAIMAYQLDRLSALYITRILRLPDVLQYFAMPNIAAGQLVVPELVGRNATAEALACAAATHLTEPAATRSMRDGYARVRETLGAPGVAGRVADRLVALVGGTADSLGARVESGAGPRLRRVVPAASHALSDRAGSRGA